MPETVRVTFYQYVYQHVDFPALEVQELTDDEVAERARVQLQPRGWEPSGDSSEVVLNGIDVLPEGWSG